MRHGALSPYFMWRIPQLRLWERVLLRLDGEYLCRVANRRFFISVEFALPFKEGGEKPLGFICWMEVTKEAFANYRRFRELEDDRHGREEHIEGRLANPIPAVQGSLGCKVRVAALAGDPTPYVVWVEPGTPLARRVSDGADAPFWHAVAALQQSGR
jgi:hypothetical protein